MVIVFRYIWEHSLLNTYYYIIYFSDKDKIKFSKLRKDMNYSRFIIIGISEDF